MNDVYVGQKKRNMQKLLLAQKLGKVDKKILNLLNTINNIGAYYTTSSCSGRCIVLQLPSIGDKKNAMFLGKWHETFSVEQLNSALAKRDSGLLFFLCQSPILHVVSKDLAWAELMIEAGLHAGFKNSCLRSFCKKIVVELCSTETLHVPLGKDNSMYVDSSFLYHLTDVSNQLFVRSEEKIKKLDHALKQQFE